MDIFWIDATSEETVKTCFAALSPILDPFSSPTLELDARASTTRRALADRDQPWLMVFDNYDDPTSYDIRGFIPENTLSRVIITSRHTEVEYLAEESNRIQLQGLEESEVFVSLYVILSQDSGHVIRIVLVCCLNGDCRSIEVRYGVYILKLVRSTS
jgi:hypothetical protein